MGLSVRQGLAEITEAFEIAEGQWADNRARYMERQDSWVYIHAGMFLEQKSKRMEALAWLKENSVHRWTVGPFLWVDFYFENVEDAIRFKLVWG